MMIKRIAAVGLVLLSPLSAQEGAGERDKGIGVRFLAEIAPPQIGEVVVAEEGKQSEPFALPINHLTPRMEVAARQFAVKSVEKGVALCNVQLPYAGRNFLVILVVAKPAGFRPIVVRADDPDFRGGDVFFINRSDKLILGKLGTSPLVLKPMSQVIGRPAGARDERFFDIAFASREAGKDRMISSTRWPVDDQVRSYVFFFPRENGRLTYRAVDEHVPVAAAP